MRAAPLALFNDPSALAKVDLDLFAWQALHAPKRRIGVGVEPPHESFDGLVATGEPVFGGEILIDPLRREPSLASGLDRTAVRLALASSTRQRPGGRMAGFGSASPVEPAVEMAGFESAPTSDPAVEMAGFAGSRYLRTVPRSMPSSRAIRRRDHPRAARATIACCSFTLSWFIAPLVPHRQHRAQSYRSKWLVLNRPVVAGFK